MTIKQLLEITPATQEIWVLNCKGCVFEIDRQEPIAVAAYGDFSIASIKIGTARRQSHWTSCCTSTAFRKIVLPMHGLDSISSFVRYAF